MLSVNSPFDTKISHHRNPFPGLLSLALW